MTLIRCDSSHTWGVALRMPPPGEQRDAAVSYLELREQQYDLRLRLPLHASESGPEPALSAGALVYIGSDDTAANVNWLGEASHEAVAATIAAAEGPSGRNSEYLFRLAEGLRRIGKEDEGLFALEALVRQMVACAAPAEAC